MKITKAEFRSSSSAMNQLPGDMPEFAFIGRSNVGKSSLINMLTDRPGLAKVSSVPGKTRLINHFLINDSWYLVDLPGYGYARTSKKARQEFSKLIRDYVTKGERMQLLFVLVDSRLEPQRIDLEFINFLGGEGVPFAIVFTKCDKISSSAQQSYMARYKRELLKTWEELPPIFASSTVKKLGREEILDFIEQCL